MRRSAEAAAISPRRLSLHRRGQQMSAPIASRCARRRILSPPFSSTSISNARQPSEDGGPPAWRVAQAGQRVSPEVIDAQTSAFQSLSLPPIPLFIPILLRRLSSMLIRSRFPGHGVTSARDTNAGDIRDDAQQMPPFVLSRARSVLFRQVVA